MPTKAVWDSATIRGLIGGNQDVWVAASDHGSWKGTDCPIGLWQHMLPFLLQGLCNIGCSADLTQL
jgi:hypothetical protein